MTGRHAENKEFSVPDQKIVTMTNFWFGTLGQHLPGWTSLIDKVACKNKEMERSDCLQPV